MRATAWLLLHLIGAAVVAAGSGPIEQAQEALRRNDPQAALDLVLPILATIDRPSDARLVAGAAYLGIGNLDAAEEQLKWLERRAASTPDTATLRGRILLAQAEGRASEGYESAAKRLALRAAQAFETALRDAPDRPRLVGLRADALARAGKTSEALQAFGEWVRLEPASAAPYRAAARFAASTDREDEIRKLLAAAPADDEALRRDIRFEVLRARVAKGATADLVPLLDELEAEEPRADRKSVLSVYRRFLSIPGEEFGGLALDGDGEGLDPEDWDCLVAARKRQIEMARKGPRTRGTPPPPVRSDGVTLPVLKNKIIPEVPAADRLSRHNGKVVLLAVVRRDGSTRVVSILESNSASFAANARAAVSRWTYEPGRRDGVPTAFLYTIAVTWHH